MIELLLFISIFILWSFGLFVLVSSLIHEYEMRAIVGRFWIIQFLFCLMSLGVVESLLGYVIFNVARQAFSINII